MLTFEYSCSTNANGLPTRRRYLPAVSVTNFLAVTHTRRSVFESAEILGSNATGTRNNLSTIRTNDNTHCTTLAARLTTRTVHVSVLFRSVSTFTNQYGGFLRSYASAHARCAASQARLPIAGLRWQFIRTKVTTENIRSWNLECRVLVGTANGVWCCKRCVFDEYMLRSIRYTPANVFLMDRFVFWEIRSVSYILKFWIFVVEIMCLGFVINSSTTGVIYIWRPRFCILYGEHEINSVDYVN